jgi:peptidylprolyl isomerase
MARTSEPDSAGAQFFITIGPMEHLNGQFTIFGEVVEGMDVIARLTQRDPQSPNPPEGDIVQTIIVREVPQE